MLKNPHSVNKCKFFINKTAFSNREGRVDRVGASDVFHVSALAAVIKSAPFLVFVPWITDVASINMHEERRGSHAAMYPFQKCVGALLCLHEVQRRFGVIHTP